MYEIVIAPSVAEDVADIRTLDRRRIMDAIEEQLSWRPTVPTRQRKILSNVDPPFETAPPVWELRIGEFRVFYDVNDEERRVYVRAVRRKPPHRTTGDIL